MVLVIINVMIMTIVINIVLIIKSISQHNCVHDYVIVIIVIANCYYYSFYCTELYNFLRVTYLMKNVL